MMETTVKDHSAKAAASISDLNTPPQSPENPQRYTGVAPIHKCGNLTPPLTPVSKDMAPLKPDIGVPPGLGISTHDDVFRVTTGLDCARDDAKAANCRLFAGFYMAESKIAYGLWSEVWKGSAVQIGTGQSLSSTEAVAIKRPTSVIASKVIKEEAIILTYLFDSSDKASSYVVPLLGLDKATHSLIMDYHPLTLEARSQRCAATMRANFSSKTMFDPVVGIEEWKHFARSLVGALQWLSDLGCVHGDVKPANILLREMGASTVQPPFHPLLCDFSSAHLQTRDAQSTIPTANLENDAITTSFAAPEVLTAYASSDSTFVPTFESDVFSLGVTLIVAATGEDPYKGIGNVARKLAWARQGIPLDAASSTASFPTRIMRSKWVAKALEGAVRKSPDQRWNAKTWLEVLDRV